ncbi:hypothetical protein AAZV13_03G022200 [Glycine max]
MKQLKYIMRLIYCYYLRNMMKALFITIIVLFLIIRVPAVQISQQENGGRKIHVDDILDGTKIVRVTNAMNDGIVVHLHCQSKDTDFHEHVLAVGEHQEWSFKDNLFGTTLYWCTMDAINVHVSFEVYNVDIEENICNVQCNRNLKNDGAYFYHQFESKWEKRLAWYVPNITSV